jgi:hypothetical protein
MKKHTRLFLFGAAGVLVVGLGTGLVASIVGVQNLGILPDRGPDELEYVPSDVRLIAFANVADVMHSELREKLRGFEPSRGDADDSFQAETGINLETDIDYVVAFMAGDEQMAPPTMLARGRFDEVRIRGFMQDQGGSVEDYKGNQLILDEQQRMAVTFVEPGLAIVGMPAALRLAIDTKASGTGIRDNARLMQHIKDADDGNAWAVARFDALTRGRLPSEIANRLPSITWFSATANINGGVHGVLRADTRDEAAAQNLRDVIRGFVALARMQVGETPAALDLMNSFELGGQGTTVSLGFSISTDILDALAAFVPRPGSIDRFENRRPGDQQQDSPELALPSAENPAI